MAYKHVHLSPGQEVFGRSASLQQNWFSSNWRFLLKKKKTKSEFKCELPVRYTENRVSLHCSNLVTVKSVYVYTYSRSPVVVGHSDGSVFTCLNFTVKSSAVETYLDL